MKLILPSLALCSALCLPSCVVPTDYGSGPGFATASVGYSSYDTLPRGFSGDSYYYGGRYYSGGLFELGNFSYGGRSYGDRYFHNGRYFYGGRHENHGPSRTHYGNDPRPGNQHPFNRPRPTGLNRPHGDRFGR